MKQRTTLLPDALLILTTFIWGSGFAITNLAVLSGMPLSMLLTLRFLIPGVIMMVLFRKELPSASSEDLRFGAVAGVILFVAFVAQTYGIKYTTPANNAFLTTTNVIMVPLISWGVFRQRPQLRLGLLTMLCFVGMSVLSWSPGLGVAFNLGDWLSILCAMGFACHISYLGLSSAMACSAAVLSLVQIMVAGSLSLVMFLFLDRGNLTAASFWKGFWPCVYLGIFSTGLCFFFQNWAQRRIPPARTAIILSCEGLFGAVFSVLFGYDSFTPQLVVGGGLILLSVILVQIDTRAIFKYLFPKLGSHK